MYMRQFTDEPDLDAERYYEAQEVQYAMENSCATCDCCGRDCGAEEHFDVNGRIACSEVCARKLLSDGELSEIKDDFVRDHPAEVTDLKRFNEKVDEYIEDNLDEIIDEWLEDHVIEAGTEYELQH